jgi:hypothetical protein
MTTSVICGILALFLTLLWLDLGILPQSADAGVRQALTAAPCG